MKKKFNMASLAVFPDSIHKGMQKSGVCQYWLFKKDAFYVVMLMKIRLSTNFSSLTANLVLVFNYLYSIDNFSVSSSRESGNTVQIF